MEEIINRVAGSGIVTLDLGDYYPEGKRAEIDLKNQLWQGLVLKEKDFREFISSTDWQEFTGQHVAVFCSADALIPTWAYMLVSSSLSGIAKTVHFGSLESLESALWTASLSRLNPQDFEDARVVVKGCADKPVSAQAFIDLSFRLKPFVKSLMFGEPCSTVPVYKKAKS
jgi:hypothetical protein